MLTSVEHFWLNWHAEQGAEAARRRARLILGAAAGRDGVELAAAEKITPAGLEAVLNRFEARRLAVFPRPVLSVDELLTAARVDREHAAQVAEHAGRLFDLTLPAHGLPAHYRPLLETAARLHNLGLEIDAPQHHTAGRDLLLAVRLAGHDRAAQNLLACAIRFHRKTVRPHKEPAWAALPRRLQQPALILSALLRIADGLDYSQTQTTRLEAVVLGEAGVTLRVSGPHAREDGTRALAKSDLWEQVCGSGWALTPPPPDLAALAQAALDPTAPLALTAARALAEQLLRWEAAEAGARAGQPAALKAVRAAARRSRAALELFRPYLKKKAGKPLSGALKQAEAALAEVRDWDVVIEAAGRAADGAAWPFLEAWRAARAAALTQAVAWLEGPEAAAIRDSLLEFVSAPPAKRRSPGSLAVDGAALLLARVTTLADYAAGLDETQLETYHALRRQGVKRCRFALECLAPALGAAAQRILKDLIRAQDRLGALNDATVAAARLADWLTLHPEDESARQYQALCMEAALKHLRRFPHDWAAIQPEALRLRVLAVAARLDERYSVDEESGAGPDGPAGG